LTFPSGGAPVVRVAVGWLRSVPFGSVCLLVGQALEISCVYKARQTNTNLKTDWLIVEFLITKNHQIKTANNIGRQLLFGFISLFLVYP